MNNYQAVIISLTLMSLYVIFGGVIGTSVVGIIKTILIYLCISAVAFVVLTKDGGLARIHTSLPSNVYFNFFSRGAGTDIGAALSLVIGISSTQTYMQVVLSGRDDKTTKRGALISRLLIPLIGVGSLLAGLKMKITFPDMNPGFVLPMFIYNNFHPFFAGLSFAGLLMATIGTGAGLALGGGNIIVDNLYDKEKPTLKLSRLTVLIIFSLAGLLGLISENDLILSWSFLGLAIRGSVLFVPVLIAFFLPDEGYCNTFLNTELGYLT